MKALMTLLSGLMCLLAPFSFGPQRMAMADVPNRFPIDAFGCEWDPHFFTAVNQRHGCGEDDLALVKSRMEKLGIQRVRMMILPEWYEPRNDAFTFDQENMRTVFAYLDICQALDVKVTLTWWGAQRYADPPWLAFPEVTDWVSAPNDLDEMAENIVYLLSYIFEAGYTCVDDVILQNEPSYSFCKTQGVPDINYYIEYYKTVYNALAAAGLGDKITLVGSDDAENLAWFQAAYDGLKDICGKFNSHCYQGDVGDYFLNFSIRRYVSQRTRYAPDRPFFMGEFGDGSTTGAYTATSVDTYGRGLFLPTQVINSLNAGSTGSLYWPLHDVYYYDGTPGDADNGGLMSQGLFAYKDDGDWRVRPTYHAWGLICNTLLPGAAVYGIRSRGLGFLNRVDAVAAKLPGGGWTVLAVNRSGKDRAVQLKAGAIDSTLHYYLYSEGTVTESDDIIRASGTVTPQNGVIGFSIPAQSFVILSTIII